MPKFVVSTTLKDPEWNNTTVLASGDATAEVRKLKEDFDGELQVPGSQRLVQELIEKRPRRPDQPDGFPGDPRNGQEGLRREARATQPEAQGIEGGRRWRRGADLRRRSRSGRLLDALIWGAALGAASGAVLGDAIDGLGAGAGALIGALLFAPAEVVTSLPAAAPVR